MTISSEYKAELRGLAKDIAVSQIQRLLDDRMRIMEELPYAHLTREEDDEVADFVEAYLRGVKNFLEAAPI
jgi:hypothetical protein